MNNDPRGWTNGALKLFHIKTRDVHFAGPGFAGTPSWAMVPSKLRDASCTKSPSLSLRPKICNHNHVKYVKYCQIMYLDLFGYTPHLYIRILMSSLGFSYILVTCIPGDKHFSSQGVNTISQVSIFCTPSLKNSSKPDRERQLAGVWKCRVLYIVIFIWTSTNTNMEMSCLHQYRIQKGCSMMPRYSIYSCSKLAFRAAPGRNANPFTIEVWTWTSTEKIRDHFHNWLGACPGFPTGMPIDSWRN